VRHFSSKYFNSLNFFISYTRYWIAESSGDKCTDLVFIIFILHGTFSLKYFNSRNFFLSYTRHWIAESSGDKYIDLVFIIHFARHIFPKIFQFPQFFLILYKTLNRWIYRKFILFNYQKFRNTQSLNRWISLNHSQISISLSSRSWNSEMHSMNLVQSLSKFQSHSLFTI
jgi:hypothetical protein